ncbi:MAG: hypothetical protein VX079_10310, partial [Pseudomonadota bacterium]|nr:hypothetical protein [Pseudomonadota bacterium]
MVVIARGHIDRHVQPREQCLQRSVIALTAKVHEFALRQDGIRAWLKGENVFDRALHERVGIDLIFVNLAWRLNVHARNLHVQHDGSLSVGLDS